jgi:hypothetical protein
MLPSVDISTIPEGATLDDKMDMVLSLLLKQTKQLSVYEEKISSLEAENKSLRSTVNTLSKEMHSLKSAVNNSDQQRRGNTVRLLGLPMSEDEVGATDGGKSLATRVYDRIIKPILAAARAKGAIPSCASVIEECYRAGKASSDKSKPPPVVIKFCSKQIRLTIMRNKKAGMPAPSAADISAGIKRYVIVEDLTRDTLRALKGLAADERVGKAWSIDGSIRFTLASDQSNSVKRVKSVYDSINSIISNVS